MKHEIEANGDRVWINTADGMVGRFSKRGIDVHGEGHCAPGVRTGTMRSAPLGALQGQNVEHHGIVVPETAKPRWL